MASTLLAVTAVVGGPSGSRMADAAVSFGPTAPYGPNATVIPTWYGDATGLRLQPCFTGPPTCVGTAAQFAPPNGEAFYFNATTTLNTAPPPGQKALVSKLTMALEGAFVPAPGPDVFQRIRMRIQTPQTGTYTVTYPYGTRTFDVASLGAGYEINDTVDTGCLVQPCNFALAAPAGGGSIEPFLQWAGGAPPLGFVSDGVTPHAVTGSPGGTNFLRIQGPGINPSPTTNTCPGFTGAPTDCMQTDLFVLQGQLASNLAPAPTSVAFGSQPVGTTGAAQALTLTNTGANPITVGAVSIGGANAGDFAVAAGDTCSGATVAPGATCSVPMTFTPGAIGARAGQLSVPSNDPASPLTVSLTGTGVGPPAPNVTAPAGGSFTNANPVVVAGSAVAGNTVTVSEGATALGQAVADAAGHWSVGVTLAEGAHSVSATQTDAGGVTGTPSAPVGFTVDRTAPTITGAAATAPNANGWYVNPVTVRFTCSDALSGVASCPADAVVGSQGLNQSVSGTATDKAGNTATATVSGLDVDTVPPTITGAPTTAPNANGWYTGPVAVRFTCSDATSGVAACPADVVVSGQGMNQSASGTATDNAGNSATAIVSGINIDTAPPTITGAPTAAPDANGWYDGPVTVHFTCIDSTSGVASCPADVVVSAQGSNQSVSGTATDQAGNSASTTVSGISIDTDPPTITGAPTTAPNANGWYSAPVTVHFTCTDGLSGIATCPADVVLGAQGANQSVSGTATDKAANSAAFPVSGISIDTAAPSSGFTTANGSIVMRPGNVVGAAADNLSGVAGVTVTFTPAMPGGTPVTSRAQLSCAPGSGARSCTWSAQVPAAGGMYTVTSRAVDVAGNSETRGSPITILVL